MITDNDYSVSTSTVGGEQSDRGSTQGWATCKGGAAAKLQQQTAFPSRLGPLHLMRFAQTFLTINFITE